jgi:CelD/BcsL family acetyltransferase involved in cellulose biosynthesis
MTALHCQAIRDYDALLALEQEWEELVERAGIEHPFVRHGWVCAWWRSFGAGKELYVVAVRAGETLVALAPLMRSRALMYGVPVWRMEFIANVHTPRFDFVIAKHSDEAYGAILDHLHHDAPRWDLLVMPELAETSRTVPLLGQVATSSHLRLGMWVAGASPRIAIPRSFDQFWRQLSAKRRSTFRNRLQRTSRLGDFALEVVGDAAHLECALRDGLRIEAAGWKGAAGTAIAMCEDLTRFYAQVAASAARAGTLRLLFLKVGERRVAFAYCLRQGRTLYLLKSGYDPAYAACSPSNVLLLLAIEAAAHEGLEAIDLLGCDDPWKRAWTDQQLERRWLFLFQRTLRAQLVYFAKVVVAPWLRRLHAAFSARAARDPAPERAVSNVLRAQS